jgi:uncharacterized membrane protein (Fun14 family)
MADDNTTSIESGARRLARLSGFQVKALMLALIVSVAGAAGMAWHWVDQRDDRQHVEALPEDARQLLEKHAADSDAVRNSPIETWTAWFGRHGVRIGLTFLGAFAIGYAFRTFIKTMAILSALAVSVMVALSYFNVFNVDLTAVEQSWQTHGEWVTTQATRLKDALWAYLPSSTTAFVGFFVGMLRK